MGLVIMFCVSMFVFLVLEDSAGTSLSAIVSTTLFISWFTLNRRAARIGRLKSDIHTYFIEKENGASHEEALEKIIYSHFPFSREKQIEIKDWLLGRTPESNGEDKIRKDLTDLVFHIFTEEQAKASVKVRAKRKRKIEQFYESFRKKYNNEN